MQVNRALSLTLLLAICTLLSGFRKSSQVCKNIAVLRCEQTIGDLNLEEMFDVFEAAGVVSVIVIRVIKL